MKNITNTSLNKLIIKSMLEILLVIVILIISYFVFTNANLSSASLVAKSYDEGQYNVYVMYGKTAANSEAIALNEKIVDQGELSVKNPNKTSLYADVVLMIKEDENLNLATINMAVDDLLVDLSQAELKNGYYELTIKTEEMQAYDSFKSTVTIFADPLETPKIDYTFKILESFYQ